MREQANVSYAVGAPDFTPIAFAWLASDAAIDPDERWELTDVGGNGQEALHQHAEERCSRE